MDANSSGYTPKYKLRGYQQDASDSIIKDLESFRTTSAVLPTGSGKSLIFIDVIDRLRPKLGIDGNILVLCHLIDPLNQLFEAYQSLGERPARLKFWTSRLFPTIQFDTVFCTMQKMSQKLSLEYLDGHMKSKMVRRPKYILIDEAHSFGADSYNKILKLFPDAQVIGLSATPFRSNRYSFGLFESVSYTISMSELIDQGYLVRPELTEITIPDDMETDGGRIALSYKIWKERESNRGLVTIVYFPTTEIAKDALTSFTQDKSCRCSYIDGKTKVREAKKILKAAREGEYDVIINCKKLETGVDIPNIGAVVQTYPVGSVVVYMQRMGRALRLFDGKNHANIYMVGDTPSIESGKWQHLHKRALMTRDPLPSELLEETLVDEDDKMRDHLLLAWTEKAIEACKILEGKELVGVSRLLAGKKFPKKYDAFINQILNKAMPSEGYDDSPISKIQMQIITERYGLEERHVRKMSKKEASGLINAFTNHLASDPFIIQSGPHLGKHPSFLHPYARKFGTGETKRALKAWWKAGRPKPREKNNG